MGKGVFATAVQRDATNQIDRREADSTKNAFWPIAVSRPIKLIAAYAAEQSLALPIRMAALGQSGNKNLPICSFLVRNVFVSAVAYLALVACRYLNLACVLSAAAGATDTARPGCGLRRTPRACRGCRSGRPRPLPSRPRLSTARRRCCRACRRV